MGAGATAANGHSMWRSFIKRGSFSTAMLIARERRTQSQKKVKAEKIQKKKRSTFYYFIVSVFGI